MLWLNLVIVAIPALVLAIEPVNKAVIAPSEPMDVEEDEQKPVRFHHES